MFVVRKLTFALGLPFGNLELFSSRQPIHSAFLWPLWDKLKIFAGTVLTLAGDLLLRGLYIMLGVFVAAEAETLAPDPTTLLFLGIRVVSNLVIR